MSMSKLRLLIVGTQRVLCCSAGTQVYRTMPRVTGFGRGGSKHKKKAHGTHSEREGNQGITGPLFNTTRCCRT